MNAETSPRVGSGPQRLFVALWPPAEVARQIHERIVRELDAVAARRARIVTPGNLHSTLAFLGQVAADRADCYSRVVECLDVGRFDLNLDCLGYWPRRRLIWIGSSHEPTALRQLIGSAQTELRNCGFEPEERPYVFHLSLARHVGRPLRGMSKASTGEIIKTIDPISWTVSEVSLVASDTRPEGAVYTPLVRRALPSKDA